MIRYQREVSQLLYPCIPQDLGFTAEKILALLERPQNSKLGDIAFPCFLLAKALKKSPPQIAQELVAQVMGKSTNFSAVVATGPYINFTLSPVAAYEFPLAVWKEKERFGHSSIGKNKKALIEYSSPNVAKELHIGHFRTTMLGQALNNLYQAIGYEVIAVNHLGDWGSQFGKVAYAFKHWGNEDELNAGPIAYLTKLYVKFNEEEEKNPELANEARQFSKKIESGDPELSKIRQRFCDLSIENLKRIYARLNVKFDHFLGQSFYFDKTAPLLAQLKEKNLLIHSDGAEVVNLEEWKMPPCLIITGDGTTLYATRDIAAAMYRQNTFKPDETLYVVGNEQQLHFRQVFKVIELLGHAWAQTLKHVNYGLYRFKDGKFSTRKGRVILFEEVADEAYEKVKAIIEEKNPDLANKEEVAEIVGLGAVIYNDLSTDRIKDVEFDWNSILDFEGDTGPYIQYCYARASSILRQAETKGMKFSQTIPEKLHPELANSEATLDLLKMYGRFEHTIQSAAAQQKPSLLANYVLDLAKAFNGFYRNVKVLDDKAPKELTDAKLALVWTSRQVLKNALEILCIKAPEAM